MTQNNLFITREQIFGKGYNDKYPPELIPRGYLAKALNAVISQNRVEKRKGYTAVSQDMGNKPLLGLHGITTSNGTKRMYAFISNAGATAIEVWEWYGSGSWSKINDTLLTSLTRGEVNCVNAEDVVYAFDGGSVPVKISPGSPSTVAAVTDPNFPKGSMGRWFHNFLFVVVKNTLYWSKLEDSDNFTDAPTGNVIVNPSDGDEIYSIETLGDELMLFKKNRVWSLTGFGTDAFTVSDINERITGYGTRATRGTVNIGSDIIYVSDIGGVPEFRSLQRSRYGTIVSGGSISDDISGTMATLNKEQITKISGVFDGDNIYYSVPESGSAVNTFVLVYNLANKGWVKWTGLHAALFTVFDFSNKTEVYFGESRNDSLVHKLDNSKSDNGEAIEFDVRTRRYGADRPEIQKKWKYLYMTTDSSGDHDLTVNHSTDGFGFHLLDTVNLKTIGTTFPFLFPVVFGVSDIKRKRLHYAKETSYFDQLQYYNNAADEDVVIRDWELIYKNRGLRDAYKSF